MTRSNSSLELLRHSEQSVQNLFENELRVYTQLGDNYIELLSDATSRYPIVCTEKKGHKTKEEFFVQIAVAALASNVVNQLEAFQLCLKNGLLQPGISISRTAFETTLLAQYLVLNPSQAIKWAGGKKIEIYEVRNNLPEKEEYSLLYKMMSGISHPNFSSVNHLLQIDKETYKVNVLLGNTLDLSRILNATLMFLHSCRHSTSTFISDVFGFIPKSDDWVEFFGRLGLNEKTFEELQKQIESQREAG